MQRADATSGMLGAGVLPSRIAAVAAGGGSGRLVVAAETGSFELYFALGRLVGAGDGSIGGFQASLQGLDPSRLADGVRRARLSGRRLSVELAAAGVLDGPGVCAAVESHAGAVLGRGLQVRRGRWSFETGLDRIPEGAEIHLGVSPARVLLAAARSLTDDAVLGFHLGDPDRVVAVAADVGASDAALSPAEGFVLSRVSGRPTLSEVLVQAGSGLDAGRALLGLICAGLVRVTDDPPRRRATEEQESFRREFLALSGRLATLSHFDVLGVPTDVSPAALRAAWARRAVRFHPDRLGAPALADLVPRAGAIFSRMSEAFRVLSDPEGREAYVRKLGHVHRPRPAATPDATLPPRTAPGPAPAAVETPKAAAEATAPARGRRALSAAEIEGRFFEARRHVREERYWDALQIGETLLHDVRGGLLRERLHLLCARCRAENPLWQRDAVAGLRAALEEFPRSAEIHYELARLYQRVGLEQRAKAELRATLDCDPGHVAARKELSAVSETPSGILRGLRERLGAAREHTAS